MKQNPNLKKLLLSPLTLVWVCTFMDVIGLSILSPFLPQFILAYGATLSQTGWVLSANAFIAFFSSIIWGSLSDKFGRKPTLLICRLGSVMGYLLLAFSPNIYVLIAARLIDGIFARGILISLTVVGDWVPEEQRSMEMSKIGLAWILGNLLGPAIGVLLVGFGLRGLGLFCAGLSFAALLITQLTLKESKVHRAAELAEGKRQPVFSIRLLKEYTPRSLLAQSQFMSLGHFIFSMTVSLFMLTRFHMDNVQIGLMLTIIGVVNLLIRLFVFPIVLVRLRDERALMVGLWILLAGFISLMFLDQFWQYALVYILISFATTISIDLMNGIMSRNVNPSRMGEMIGMNSAVENISLILGPVIGSTLLGVANPLFYGMSSAVFTLVALVIGRRFLGFSAAPRPQKDVRVDR